MKINQYVRYKAICMVSGNNGEDYNSSFITRIGRLCGILPITHVDLILEYVLEDGNIIHKDNIIVSDNNIINLVKVGDLVNGYRVVEIIEKNRKKEPSTMVYCEYGDNIIGFYNEDIKNVITRDQYRLMNYEVKK